MYYFAYGSNMDKDDLDEWCKIKVYKPIQFRNACPAKLKRYKLIFNYFSKGRNGGAANIIFTGKKNDIVYGLLLEINGYERKILRRKEGYPKYYDEIIVKVEKLNGIPIKKVYTYKVLKMHETAGHQYSISIKK